MKKSNTFARPLILMAALIIPFLLTSCASSGTIKPIISECDKPEVLGNTYRDIIEAYLKRGEAIDECNLRIKAARDD